MADQRPTNVERSDGGSGRGLDVISSLWIGELTPLEQLCLTSFVRQGHPFHLYTYGDVGAVPEGVAIRDANEILPESEIFHNRVGFGTGSVAGFSDVFRFKLLLDRGGWWVDTDVFCLRPFEFSAPYVLGAEDKPVATGVIKAPHGSELMQRCFERAGHVDRANFSWNIFGVILEHTVRELGLMRIVLEPAIFSPILWREIPEYVRGERLFVRSPKSFAVHLYNEMWRVSSLNKHGRFPPTSLVEVLRRALPALPLDRRGA